MLREVYRHLVTRFWGIDRLVTSLGCNSSWVGTVSDVPTIGVILFLKASFSWTSGCTIVFFLRFLGRSLMDIVSMLSHALQLLKRSRSCYLNVLAGNRTRTQDDSPPTGPGLLPLEAVAVYPCNIFVRKYSSRPAIQYLLGMLDVPNLESNDRNKIVMAGLRRHYDHRLQQHHKLASKVQKRLRVVKQILIVCVPFLSIGLIWSYFRLQSFQTHITSALGMENLDSEWGFGQVVAVIVFLPALVEALFSLPNPAEDVGVDGVGTDCEDDHGKTDSRTGRIYLGELNKSTVLGQDLTSGLVANPRLPHAVHGPHTIAPHMPGVLQDRPYDSDVKKDQASQGDGKGRHRRHGTYGEKGKPGVVQSIAKQRAPRTWPLGVYLDPGMSDLVVRSSRRAPEELRKTLSREDVLWRPRTKHLRAACDPLRTLNKQTRGRRTSDGLKKRQYLTHVLGHVQSEPRRWHAKGC
ncbi:hypothetical protein KCV06_g275, partial [Aureobasidium melanogenum]